MTENSKGSLEHLIEPQLRLAYGAPAAADLVARIERLVDRWRPAMAGRRPWLDQQDAMLITYADTLQAAGEPPLRTLHGFLAERARDVLSAVHLLPFFPWTSDDGFSVEDYRVVDPAVGDWSDVAALAQDFELMFDAVINHASAESAWFEGFKQGRDPYRDFFIKADPQADYSRVVRPRALPLLTEVETADGPVHVWNTFSADQVDLNYANLAGC